MSDQLPSLPPNATAIQLAEHYKFTIANMFNILDIINRNTLNIQNMSANIRDFLLKTNMELNQIQNPPVKQEQELETFKQSNSPINKDKK